ncbi:Peptidoglycan-N-acetylglucosamine deacetylase [Choanephora cucurbitarum]|uniref:Peptidoglycan-N-acetylglucosamine deacetylase n=1 Tax=Choanephora cucurbitarum TaxID=101091 RepID=A0A1C7NAJ3_9FUNG|nr:Peptidoglycan-N-acetylglucosamine deacetylase [Choanephora cucurbitarum]
MLFSAAFTLAMATLAMGAPVTSTDANTENYSAPAPVEAPTGSNVQDGVYLSCNRPGVFALSFDDGPYQYSWDLAKSLKEQNITATFFINGNNWVNVETDSVETSDGQKTYMEVIAHYKEMGHEVASHTYEHKVLAGLSAEDVEYQMNTQSDIIKKAIGLRPAIMRPPTGAYDDNVLATLRKLGYAVVNWDVDTNDWRNHNFEEEKAAYQTMDQDTPQSIGHITLEHEVFEQTVNELVPWAIEYIKSKNYEFVTVSDCLGVPAYYS